MTQQTFLKINDKSYTINRWGTREQIKNLPKIGSVFAVPVAHALQGGSIFSSDSPQDITSDQYNIIPTALQMLFNQMEEEGTEELFDILLTGVKYQKESVTLDTFEDIGTLLQVVAKVLEVNYNSLFTGKGLWDSLKTMVPITQQTTQSKQP